VTLTVDALPGARPGTYVVNITAHSTIGETPVARTVPVMVTVFELDVAVLSLDLTGEPVVLTGNASWTVPDGTEVHIEVTVAVTREGGTGDEGTMCIITWAAVVVVVVVLLVVYMVVRPRGRMRGD